MITLLERIVTEGMQQCIPNFISADKVCYTLERLSEAAEIPLTPEIMEAALNDTCDFSGTGGICYWFENEPLPPIRRPTTSRTP